MGVILQTLCQIQRTSSSYAIWTVVPDLYNVLTIPHIQASIFNWTYLRCHWRYIENSMLHIQQTLFQIQRISFRLRYMKCGPGHIQCNFSSTYSGFYIQMNVSTPILEIYRQFNVRYTANIEPNTAHTLQLSLFEQWSRDIQCIYSSACLGFNIQL
jgi:hypothetical protein